MTQARTPAHRNETPAERLDRNWGELLQEMRVMQTGVQLIAGFLLTLPFQDRFSDLDRWQEVHYLGLVVLSCLTLPFMLSPIALHRRIFGSHIKHRLVGMGHWMVSVALGMIGVLMAGIVAFVFDVVLGRTEGLVAAAASLLVVVVLFAAMPVAVHRAEQQ